MGIFSRFRDIVGSNINALLEKAEDPEKMLKLMIREMEDTLVELKVTCAGSMAEKTKVERERDEATSMSDKWNEKARLAVEKGKEDLAREALFEKRAHDEKVERLNTEHAEMEIIVLKHQENIVELEQKLDGARNKLRVLVQRHIQAENRIRAQKDIRKYKTSDAAYRFEQMEGRIDRMEAEGDLINPVQDESLEEKFDKLERDEDIESKLEALKEEVNKK